MAQLFIFCQVKSAQRRNDFLRANPTIPMSFVVVLMIVVVVVVFVFVIVIALAIFIIVVNVPLNGTSVRLYGRRKRRKRKNGREAGR